MEWKYLREILLTRSPRLAASFISDETCDIRYWPIADVGYCTAHVRFQGQSGHDPSGESAFAVAIGSKADMGWCAAYVRL
jgi:hypothetical protein